MSDHVARVRSELIEYPLDESTLMARALQSPPPRDFVAALRRKTPSVIAEVKRASPSAGAIAGDVDPAIRAKAYEAGGAAAISVLTEPRHFHGSLADLRAVHLATTVPVLRKDFLVHPAQVIEARANGADAVLLICASLGAEELRLMLGVTRDLGMAALVETHSDEDLAKALATDAVLIGVNARDLESLEVDMTRALERLERVPSDRLAVLESGISTRVDVRAAVRAGASAILVGEALMRAEDPGAKIVELTGSGRT